MEASMLMAVLLAFIGMIESGATLRCYKCQNYVSSSSSTLLPGLNINTKTNPACADNVSPTLTSVTCTNTNDMCGLVKGSITFNSLLGSSTLKTWVRDCMQTVAGTSPGCKGNTEATRLINSFASLVNAKVSGDVCFCDTDLCNPCGATSIAILGVCISWYIIGGVGGGLLLLICVIVACCCRSGGKSRGGNVVGTAPAPAPTIIVVPGNQKMAPPGQAYQGAPPGQAYQGQQAFAYNSPAAPAYNSPAAPAYANPVYGDLPLQKA